MGDRGKASGEWITTWRASAWLEVQASSITEQLMHGLSSLIFRAEKLNRESAQNLNTTFHNDVQCIVYSLHYTALNTVWAWHKKTQNWTEEALHS